MCAFVVLAFVSTAAAPRSWRGGRPGGTRLGTSTWRACRPGSAPCWRWQHHVDPASPVGAALFFFFQPYTPSIYVQAAAAGTRFYATGVPFLLLFDRCPTPYYTKHHPLIIRLAFSLASCSRHLRIYVLHMPRWHPFSDPYYTRTIPSPQPPLFLTTSSTQHPFPLPTHFPFPLPTPPCAPPYPPTQQNSTLGNR